MAVTLISSFIKPIVLIVWIASATSCAALPEVQEIREISIAEEILDGYDVAMSDQVA